MLRGSKVILREKRMGDAVRDYAWRRDPELCQLDAVPPLKISFPEFLSSYAEKSQNPNPQWYRFAIENLKGKHIGNCACYGIQEESGQAEIGIMIGERECWDKGYGADAVSTLARHIFEVAQFRKLHLCTLDWNLRAQKCFQKCGFVPCGRLTRGCTC